MAASKIRVTTPDGESFVHAGDGQGVYATLCGLDGEENTVWAVGPGERITCDQCAIVFKAWRAYRPADFTLKMRVRHRI